MATRFSLTSLKRITVFLLSLVFVLTVVSPLPVFAAEQGKADKKVVRVGWYESTYCYRDQFGRRSGIAYEYQQKIAAHTGWTYEYVEDSWPNLLQMLIDGKIDLMSDVSYTSQRAELMLYSTLAMGAESYYIYIDADNKEVNPENLQTLNGKRIGVNKGSVQEELLKQWARKNGLSVNIVEMTTDEAESTAMLARGDIDLYVTLDSMGAQKRMVPVSKIGASDYYFTVNKNRQDLWNELNAAMISIQDEDPYFNQRLFDEYVHLVKTNSYLLPRLESWLSKHGTVRVGYLDNYLPFCSQDKSGGKLTGALNDYLAHASNCLKNAKIHFETVPYPTTAAALEAMKNGKIDCVFPINLSTYDAEERGLLTVSPIMKTELSVMMRAEDLPDLAPGKKLTVAVTKDNTNFETFIKGVTPSWTIKTYSGMEDCFRAAASKEVDGVLVSNYRMHKYDSLTSQYKLIALPTGEMMGLSFAVNKENGELYSILNKISSLSSNKDMEYALLSYISSDRKVSFMDFLKDNWIGVIVIITAVFLILLFLLSQKLKAERKMNEQQKQLEASLRRELQQKEQLQSVTRMAYKDALTSVQSTYAYMENENRLNQMIKENAALKFAVVSCDVNGLKMVNDTQGHQAGDELLLAASKLICDSYSHSPVFRIGGDEFVVILDGGDYEARDTILTSFKQLVEQNLKDNKAVVSVGMSDYIPGQDTNVQDVFVRADANMYEHKKLLKSMGAGGR